MNVVIEGELITERRLIELVQAQLVRKDTMPASRILFIAAAISFALALVGVAGIDLVTLGLLLIAVGLAL